MVRQIHFVLENAFSSAADNAIFKNRAENIECSFGCMVHSAILLKPNVANILLFNFCEQKFVQNGPITIAIDCNGLPLLIFQEKWRRILATFVFNMTELRSTQPKLHSMFCALFLKIRLLAAELMSFGHLGALI